MLGLHYATSDALIFVAILSFARGRPQTDQSKEKNAKITFSKDVRDDQLNYEFQFDTSNGISRAETGDFEQDTFETSFADIKGYYSYIAPDGYRYTVTYIADHNGYQPRLHKTLPHQLPQAAEHDAANVIDGIDDDRIGTKLLISLGSPVG